MKKTDSDRSTRAETYHESGRRHKSFAERLISITSLPGAATSNRVPTRTYGELIAIGNEDAVGPYDIVCLVPSYGGAVIDQRYWMWDRASIERVLVGFGRPGDSAGVVTDEASSSNQVNAPPREISAPRERVLAFRLVLSAWWARDDNFVIPFLPPTSPPLTYDVNRKCLVAAGEGKRALLPGEEPPELPAWEAELLSKRDREERRWEGVSMIEGDPVTNAVACDMWRRGFLALPAAAEAALENAQATLDKAQELCTTADQMRSVMEKRDCAEVFGERVSTFRAECEWFADYVGSGKNLLEPQLWIDRPWRRAASKQAQRSWSGGEESSRFADAAPGIARDDRLAQTLAAALLSEDGLAVLARYQNAVLRLERVNPALLKSDPTVRKKKPIAGGQVANSTKVVNLTEPQRELLFGRCNNVPGSAGHAETAIPVGVVIVLPRGEPAYFRGLGQRVDQDGLIKSPDGHQRLLQRFPAEYLALAAANRHSMGSSFLRRRKEYSTGKEAKAATGTKAEDFESKKSAIDAPVYYSGYRWWRTKWSAEFCDETAWEAEGRFARSWAALVDPVLAGTDPDGIWSLIDQWHPFRWRGQNAWGLKGPGRAPDVIQSYFSQILQQREPHNFIGLNGRQGENSPKEMRGFENHGLSDIRYMARVATMCREWQDPLMHNWRWLADCLSAQMMDHDFMRKIVGLKPNSTRPEPLEELQEAFEGELNKVLEDVPPERRLYGMERFEAAVASSRNAAVSELVQWRTRMEEDEANGFAAWQREMKARCRIVYIPEPSSSDELFLDVKPWDVLYSPDALPVASGGIELLVEKRPEFPSNFGTVSSINLNAYWPELCAQARENEILRNELEAQRRKWPYAFGWVGDA
jgi:hypothetical protein